MYREFKQILLVKVILRNFGLKFQLLRWNKFNWVARSDLVYICQAYRKSNWSACYFYTHEPHLLKSGTNLIELLRTENPEKWNKSNWVALAYVCQAYRKSSWSTRYFYTHEPHFLKSGTKALHLILKNMNLNKAAEKHDALEFRLVWKFWTMGMHRQTSELQN